jgi:hypothetical protein
VPGFRICVHAESDSQEDLSDEKNQMRISVVQTKAHSSLLFPPKRRCGDVSANYIFLY